MPAKRACQAHGSDGFSRIDRSYLVGKVLGIPTIMVREARQDSGRESIPTLHLLHGPTDSAK